VTSYRVGQVLYVIPAQKAQIYPMQVVEEVIKKTLEGSVTTYMVRGSPNTDETLSIDEIQGEIFDSAGKVQKALLERATNGINDLVQGAVAHAHEWYPTGFEQASDDELTSLKKAPQSGQQTQGKPPKLPKRRPGPTPELAELAAELQADNEALEVEMPDGTRVKVNSIKVPDALQG